VQTPGLVRIASSDRDFLQLVDERVSIFSFIKKLVIEDSNFDGEVMPRPKDGSPVVFPRSRFVDYRAMSGDSSDDLPGIPGVGSLTAAKLLSIHSLDDYLANPALIGAALGRANRRVEGAFADGSAAEIVARNRQLMDLRQAAARYDDLSPYRRDGAWDESAFRVWLEELRAARLDVDGAVATIAGVASRAG
jgi:DNA polymerase-1